MKKLKYLLILPILLSCGENSIDGETTLNKSHEIIVIDSCQYILYNSYAGNIGYGFFSHKGNCNNPIHVCND